MKVMVIPDSHLKIDVIEDGIALANKHRAEKIVLLGDYFDDWECTRDDYTDMIVYLKTLLRKDPRVVPLLGNHELSYLGFPCGGFKNYMKPTIEEWLKKDYRFQSCCAFDGVLYSHAGFTQSWVRDNQVLTENEIRKMLGKNGGAGLVDEAMGKIEIGRHHFDILAQVGAARGGHSAVTSPVWADMSELVNDPLPRIRQVVGHTPVAEIAYINGIYFTDVFSNDNPGHEYLMVNNGEAMIVDTEELADE